MGSFKKTVQVLALLDKDGKPVHCRQATHRCQGIVHCDHLDPKLLEGCERYECNPDERKDLWEADRQVNERNHTSVEAQAIT